MLILRPSHFVILKLTAIAEPQLCGGCYPCHAGETLATVALVEAAPAAPARGGGLSCRMVCAARSRILAGPCARIAGVTVAVTARMFGPRKS
jgi:hypothetical protein